MTLAAGAVHTGASGLGVLLLHVGLQRLLVLIMPIAFWTLECLARVARMHHGHMATQGARGAQNGVTFRAFHPTSSTTTGTMVLRTLAYGCYFTGASWKSDGEAMGCGVEVMMMVVHVVMRQRGSVFLFPLC